MAEEISKRIIGAVEEVVLKSESHEMKVLARIDTGAKMSSIDLKLAEDLGVGPAVAMRRIRSSHGKSVRPVVRMTAVVGGVEHMSEFTVIDRSHMKYPVIIGRNILENGFLVDPSKDKHSVIRTGAA